MLDFDTCNEARLRRDPAFDGRFFTAVRTTRIYCRPVCPVKHPLTKNVRYYPTAAAAEHAGYRPCLRCRPETAPFGAAWNGTRTTVERALKLIEEGALDTGTVHKLCERLGIGSRHLSRLFADQIGASLVQTAQTVRLGRAKRFLDETMLPVTEDRLQGGIRQCPALQRCLLGALRTFAVVNPQAKAMTGLRYSYIDSPVGSLLVAGDGEALHFLSFPAGHKALKPRPEWHRSDAPFAEVRRQIAAYFAGNLRQFDLPLHVSGTAFQNSVWQYLAGIPFGKTRTYGQLAAALGRPKASRAVGAANGNNPLPIILPCHRVIGSNGALTGFGGGLPTKEYLLKHEAVLDHQSVEPRLFEGWL